MSALNITAAAIQMVSGDNVELNLKDAMHLAQKAVMECGANLLVFPENFLCFGGKQQAYLAKNITLYLQKFQIMAKELNVNLVLGSIPSFTRHDGNRTDGRYRSASYVINSKGLICCQYDKVNLFDVEVDDAQGCYRESDEFEAGEATKVIELDGYSLGMSICYDLRFPNLFQELRLTGANVIVVPAAFTKVTGKAHWEVLLRARAIETQSYIIAANQGGQHTPQRETWGHSMIINPWGEIIAEQDVGKGICCAPLDLKALNEIRKAMPLIS